MNCAQADRRRNREGEKSLNNWPVRERSSRCLSRSVSVAPRRSFLCYCRGGTETRKVDVDSMALSSLRLLIVGLACSACAPGASQSGSGSSELHTLEQDVFGVSCSISQSCHGGDSPRSGVSLDSPVYDKVVGQSAVQARSRVLVVPGDPDGSYLIEKLESSEPELGERMPPDYPLSRVSIERIREWIERGAPDD